MLSDSMQCVLLVKRRETQHIITLKFLQEASDMQAILLTYALFL